MMRSSLHVQGDDMAESVRCQLVTLAVSNQHFATDDGQEMEYGEDDGEADDDDDDDNGQEEGGGGVGDCEENELPQWRCKID